MIKIMTNIKMIKGIIATRVNKPIAIRTVQKSSAKTVSAYETVDPK
jgi:hypothetical protein